MIMNKQALLIILVYVTLSSAENPLDFLSKFHQNDYKIAFERLEAIGYDEAIVKSLKIVSFKHNRTQLLVNITMEFKLNLESDLDMEIRWCKFLSNEYRQFPMQYRVNYCDSYNSDMMGLKSGLTCGDFTGCNIYKNRVYHICNFLPDESKFPPFVPSGSYMLDMYYMASKVSQNAIMHWKGYVTIYRPIKY